MKQKPFGGCARAREEPCRVATALGARVSQAKLFVLYSLYITSVHVRKLFVKSNISIIELQKTKNVLVCAKFFLNETEMANYNESSIKCLGGKVNE